MSNKTQKVEQTSSQQLDPRMAAYLYGSNANGQTNNEVTKNMPGLFDTAMTLYNQGPAEYYNGNTYAGLTDTAKNAISGATDYLASGQANAGGNAAMTVGSDMIQRANNLATQPTGATSQFTGVDYKPALSQSLSGQVDMSAYNPMADAITSRVNRNFNESIMPSIRQGAVANGTLGGSRQGIAEGLAASRMNEDLGSSLSSLYGNAFTQAQNARNIIAPQMATLALGQQGQDRQYGLDTSRFGLQANSQMNDAMTNGVGLLSQGAQQPLQSYQNLIGLGGLLQSDQQNQTNADVARWNFDQNKDWQNLGNISGLLTGNATLGASQTGTQGMFYNPTMQWMGALGGMVNSAGGAKDIASAAMMLSDKRVKKDIKRIGETSKGFPLYLFRYLWDVANESPRIGVMAQDVEQVMPEAVITRPDGVKTVNYAMVM